MKKLLLAGIAAMLLAFPATASAELTPSYYETSVCVSLNTLDVEGPGPIFINLYTPAGKLFEQFKTSSRVYKLSLCVTRYSYELGGGYGWFASARIGGTSLGSTVF